MLATLNSWGLEPIHSPQDSRKRRENRSRQKVALGLLFFFLILPVMADSAPTNHAEGTTGFSRQAEATFKAAQTRFQAQPTNAQAGWQLGRAAYDWAEF